MILIEDSVAMQSLIESELQRISGVGLIGIAAGPAEGLLILDRSPVDLVIADLFLHEGTAFEILEWLRCRQAKASVLVITNAPSLELREQCLSSGASGFFDKAKGFDWLPKEIEAVRRRMVCLDELVH